MTWINYERMAAKWKNEFYYITHIENLPSILERGIYSHDKLISEKIETYEIFDHQIAENRRKKTTDGTRKLSSYVNVFLSPRNAMLYRVIEQFGMDNIVILSAGASKFLRKQGVYITDGNAARSDTEIISDKSRVSKIGNQATKIEYWKNEKEKSQAMAECLVPDIIPKDLISTIFVPTEKAKKKVGSFGNCKSIDVLLMPHMFFQNHVKSVVDNISLVRGDMFFSRLQTLTISVNCVGVMGKGLASSAKHRFPEVYVHYQGVCRSKKLTTTRPNVYKPETSFKSKLYDIPISSEDDTWFLLFATKKQWRDNSRIEWVEAGLQWLVENYQKEGIQSIALPALGCGLGNLSWEEVGPLMVYYLRQIKIPVEIYLPFELDIKDETKYLLDKKWELYT